MEIKFYDIGLNLFCRQFKEPEKIISDAFDEGVGCILTGSDMHENALVNDFELIEKYISENSRIVAVGECGLDYDRMFSTKENQIRCLEKHIVLAEKLNKPLFLHERNAATDFAKRFKNHSEVCKRSVVHCFTGDKKTLEKYLDMGFYIGITGWICDDRRANELRDAVSILPLDRVLLETDAPYLIPKNVKGLGRVNLPQYIKYVAKDLAKYMKADEEELVLKAKENTEKVFLGR